MARLTNRVLIERIRANRGLVMPTARQLGVTRSAIYNRAARYPAVAEALRDEREAVIDLAEGQLMAALSRGEPWAVTLALKTLGRTRGYTERVEVDSLAPPIPLEELRDRLATRLAAFSAIRSGPRDGSRPQAN